MGVRACVSVRARACGRVRLDAERLAVNNKCSGSKLRRLAVIFYPDIFWSLGPADLICQSHHSENPATPPPATHLLKDWWLCAGRTSAAIDPPDSNAPPIHIILGPYQ